MRTVPAYFVVLLLAACGTTGDPDRPVPLPPGIAPAVARAYPGQRAVSHEARSTADGTVHTVILRDGDLRTDVELTDDGTVLRERRELRVRDVPLEIMGTVNREFPDAQVPLVVRWRSPEETHYEVRIVDPAGIRSSVSITTGGMIIEDMDGVGVPADR